MSVPFVDALPGRTTISVCGESFTIQAPTMLDWNAVAQRLREQAPNLLPETIQLIKDLPPEVAKAIYEVAYRERLESQAVTVSQAVGWATRTTEGAAYLLSMLIGRHHPGQVTESQIFAYLVNLGHENHEASMKLIEKVAEACSVPAAGKSYSRFLRDVAAVANVGPRSSGTSPSPHQPEEDSVLNKSSE